MNSSKYDHIHISINWEKGKNRRKEKGKETRKRGIKTEWIWRRVERSHTASVNIDRQKAREERTERESRGRVSPKAVELSVEWWPLSRPRNRRHTSFKMAGFSRCLGRDKGDNPPVSACYFWLATSTPSLIIVLRRYQSWSDTPLASPL